MKQLLIFLISGCFLFHLEESNAAFAAHVRISPENRQKEGFDINIRSHPMDPEHHDVDIFYREMGDKKYHLIFVDREVPSDQQDFRKYATYLLNREERSKFAAILLRTVLQPGKPNSFARSDMGFSDSITLRLHKYAHDKAYIFIDFKDGNQVADGGYYYTIDLPAFIRDYEKKRKK